jgi:hypothetical protein
MIRTRGLQRSENLEEKIVRTYNRFGAKLIEAHGRFTTANEVNNISFEVPKSTIIIFLAKPGRCMFIGAGRILAESYFMNNRNMLNFFRGEAGKLGMHHGEILSRTFFEGEQCPSVNLDFKNNSHPSYGYVWKLPLGRIRSTTGPNLEAEPAPLRTEVYTRIQRGSSLLLKSVVSRLGKGVYIVNACLPPGNAGNINGTNAPQGGWENERPRAPTTTRERRRFAPFINKAHRPPRPGTKAKTFLPPQHIYKIAKPKLLSKPKMTVEQLLRSMSRNPQMNISKHFRNLRANVNTSRLFNVQTILQSPNNFVSKLGVAGRVAWRLTSNKAKFIHNRLT